jgi:hypothetical protein
VHHMTNDLERFLRGLLRVHSDPETTQTPSRL